MSKRILFIAPESFPVNGPEAIVNIKLLRVLSESGYKIDLISRRHQKGYYPSNQNLSDYGVSVNRNEIIEVDNKFNISTIISHILTYLKFGTVFRGAHWAYFAVLIAEKLVIKNHYDFVITKNAPSFLVGFYLKNKFKCKWIASWNDPYPAIKYPYPYAKGVDAKLPFFSKRLLNIMEQADFHVFPNSRLRDYMKKYLNIKDDSSYEIPHIAVKQNNMHVLESNILKIVCSGNLKHPRNPNIFLSALSKLTELHTDIVVDFVGVFEENLKLEIDKLGLNDYVNLIPPIDYNDSLAILKNYHVTLIVEANCDEGIFLPTKVGDYMQYGKVIFAISPQNGVLNDLYKDKYIQYFSSHQSDDVYNELKGLYFDFKNNNLREVNFYNKFSDSSVLEQYKVILG